MTDYTTPFEEGADSVTVRARRAGVIGVDAEGYDHRADATEDTIFVTRGTGSDLSIDRVERLGARTISEWVEFVRQERGWIDCWLDATNAGEAARRKQSARAKA